MSSIQDRIREFWREHYRKSSAVDLDDDAVDFVVECINREKLYEAERLENLSGPGLIDAGNTAEGFS